MTEADRQQHCTVSLPQVDSLIKAATLKLSAADFGALDAASERLIDRRAPRYSATSLAAPSSLKVGVGQNDVDRRDILFEVGDFAGAGNRQHHRATLEHPGKRHLARRGAVLLGNAVKHRAGARKIAGGERIPGNEADAMRRAMVEHLLA